MGKAVHYCTVLCSTVPLVVRMETAGDLMRDSFVIFSLSILLSVVTGSSEGIGRAYAFAVSDCLNNSACVLIKQNEYTYCT